MTQERGNYPQGGEGQGGQQGRQGGQGGQQGGMEQGGQRSQSQPQGGWTKANIPQMMEGVSFPQNRQGLLRHAEQKGAPDEIQRMLQNMPDRQYTNMSEVMKAISETRGQ